VQNLKIRKTADESQRFFYSPETSWFICPKNFNSSERLETSYLPRSFSGDYLKGSGNPGTANISVEING
jgi:hypothetical protein